MIEFEQPLSPEGIARRERILSLAKCAARSRSRKRRALPVVTTLLLLITSLVVFRIRPSRVNPDSTSSSPHNAADQIAKERIPTDPTNADRLSDLPSPKRQIVSYDKLLQSITNAGQPAGLVQMDGKNDLLPDTENQ